MQDEFETNEAELDALEAELESEFPISDQPELVATLPESLLTEPEPKEPPHLTSTVCDVCLELNLTSKASVIKCVECSQPFCYHYASSIDVQYCVNCMSDISVTKNTISKEYLHKDDQGNTTSIYRRRAREVKIEGLSWLFAQRRIADLNDMELDLAIEYHRNILGLMIDEQERRRNAKMHRFANVKIHVPTPSDTTVSTVTTTTVKKTRTISKNKAEEQLNALIQTLSKSKGLDANTIAAILKGAK